MASRMQTIEVDEATAALLSARAAESGVSISSLIRELLSPMPSELSEQEALEELDRRWRAHEATPESERVGHEAVSEWLKTWGTPAYKPWSK